MHSFDRLAPHQTQLITFSNTALIEFERNLAALRPHVAVSSYVYAYRGTAVVVLNNRILVEQII